MIEINDLRFTYPGGKSETIKGINFNIEKGEIFGFLGPSGAGKTTTQKIIIGILKNYSGSVKVMGGELRNHGYSYYEKIGAAFEFPNLFGKLTARENLDFFKAMYSGAAADIDELLEVAGLSKDADKKTEEFSKGMKMRLNFVRAFLNNPELVFLDEPTSGMDPVNARNIKDYIIKKRDEGTTFFLTTHNMHDADELCSRVGFMVDGGLHLIDSPRELKIKHGKKSVMVEYGNNGSTEKSEFELEAIGNNEGFLKLLKEKQIETIHTTEATLEDIFIQETGRALK